MISLYKGVVHPWLCDVMGHMTTRNYLAMFDDASYHMFFEVFRARIGEEGQAKERPRETGWVDVRQVIEYRDELRAGDLLEVKGKIARVGTKSLTFNYEMYNSATGALSATLETTSVYFDMVERTGLALTDELKAQAAKHLE